MGTVVDFPKAENLAAARMIVVNPTEHAWPPYHAACQALVEHGTDEDRAMVWDALYKWQAAQIYAAGAAERAEAAPRGKSLNAALGWAVLFLAAVGVVAIAAWLLDVAAALL